MNEHFKAPFFVLLVCVVVAGIVLGYAQRGPDRTHELIAELARDRAELAEKNDSLRRALRLRDSKTLWLARAVYSETDRPDEMRLVAWVVRNRVEKEYRGRETYREIVLDPKQFSAFNEDNPLREYYMTKPVRDASHNSRWEAALEIADEVRRRSPLFRPFSSKTLYFYSEVSMPPHSPHPDWRHDFDLVSTAATRAVEPRRFRFFKDPECRLCGEVSPAPGIERIYTTSVRRAR